MKEKDLNLNKKTMHLTFMELQRQYETETSFLWNDVSVRIYASWKLLKNF